MSSAVECVAHVVLKNDQRWMHRCSLLFLGLDKLMIFHISFCR